MVRGEPLGSAGVLLEDVIATGILSSTSAEAWVKTDWFSAADFLGEVNRLSGRMCSKLVSCQTEQADNR